MPTKDMSVYKTERFRQLGRLNSFKRWSKYGPSTDPVERFWVRVKKGKPNECWEWIAGRDSDGYGMAKTFGRGEHAHVIAWKLTNGPIQPKLSVCHKCDNPGCCNPKHLFIGTTLDNARDKVSKGRGLHGERHPMCKLTYKDVNAIRELYQTGQWTHKQLAFRFQVDRTNIGHIVNNKTWAKPSHLYAG